MDLKKLLVTVLDSGASANPLSRDFYLSSGTYYVDSVNGDDGNAGTSANAPYQNLSALPTLVANDVVSLACGSSWLGQKVKCPASGIKVGAYVPPQTSSTTTPIIDTSNTETGWTLLGGTTNVYTKTVTFDADDMYDTSTFINVFEDGAFLTNVANSATCDSTAGSYYVSSHNGTSITVGIHSTDSADPDTHDIKVAKKSHAVDARGVDDITVFDIEANRPLHRGGSIKTGRDSIIHSCTMNQTNVHACYLEDGSSVIDSIMETWQADVANSFVVFNESIPNGGVITVDGCTIGSDTYNNSAVGIYCHHNSSGEFGSLVIRNTEFKNIAVAVSSTDVPVVDIDDLTCTDVTEILRVNYAGQIVDITNATCTNTTANGASIYRTSAAVAFTLNLTNVSWQANNIGNGMIYITQSNVDITVEGCDFTTSDNAGNREGIWLEGVVTPGEIVMNNTQWIPSGAGGWNKQLEFRLLVASTFYTGDNNTFHGEFGYQMRQNNIQYANPFVNKSAQWIADTGQDANSTYLIP